MVKKREVWSRLHALEGVLYSYIKQAVGDAQIAQDLTQDVYLSALQNLDSLDPQRSLKNWLITVARNRVINYYRDRGQRSATKLADHMLTTVPDEDRVSDHVRQALRYLHGDQKKIFMLREMDGLAYSELANEMGITVSAATSLLKRARDRFSRAYLLQFLPVDMHRNTRLLPLQDLARFVNAFEAPDQLLEQVQAGSQRFFARIREGWDDMRSWFVSEQQLESIFRHLGPQKGKRTLDLGTATGFVAIQSVMKGNKVMAMDVNLRMVRHVRQVRKQLNLTGPEIIRGDILKLPFRNKKFDQLFCMLVLHHLPDPQSTLQQLGELLTEHGRLIIVDFKRHTSKDLADYMRDLWLGFNPALIRRWAAGSGFIQEQYDEWSTKKEIDVFYQIFRRNRE